MFAPPSPLARIGAQAIHQPPWLARVLDATPYLARIHHIRQRRGQRAPNPAPAWPRSMARTEEEEQDGHGRRNTPTNRSATNAKTEPISERNCARLCSFPSPLTLLRRRSPPPHSATWRIEARPKAKIQRPRAMMQQLTLLTIGGGGEYEYARLETLLMQGGSASLGASSDLLWKLLCSSQAANLFLWSETVPGAGERGATP